MTSNQPFKLAALTGCLALSMLAWPTLASDWIELGPAPIVTGSYTGRLSSVVASPTDPNKYYVGGADGGVWKTLDGGTSWIPLTDFLPICSIGALALDPTNDEVLYAGSGEANYANHSVYGLGLYKTTDGGQTWEILAQDTFAGRTFARIAVSPTNSDVLYAAIGYAGGFPARVAAKGHPLGDGPVGVFKSIDGGHNWSQLTNGIPAIAATDLVLDPGDGDRVFAAIGHIFGDNANGVYRSIDGGASFVKLAGGLPTTNIGRIALVIAPTDANRLYTVFVNKSDSSGGGASTRSVYRTDNGGDAWTDVNPGNFQASYGWYLCTAVVRPTDRDTFFLGGLDMIRGVAGGSSYSTRTPPHVDLHALAFDASERLLAADDGGLHRSPDFGNSWVSLNRGLGVIQFYAGVSLHPTSRDFLLAGFQDNGSCIRTTNLEWVSKVGGDGGWTSLSPFDPNIMLAEYQGTGNLYRSTNGGSSFNASGSGINGSDRNCFLPPHVFDPQTVGRMLYGTHRVYQSLNSGSSWTAISGDITGGSGAIRALAIAPSNSQTVYAATNDGRVLVSTDGGRNFSLKITGHPGWPRVTRELAVDPLDDSTAFLATAWFGVDQVTATFDRGDTWVSLDGDLPDVPVNVVAVFNDGVARFLFAGTDAGTYVTADDGATWTLMGLSLPYTPVMDLVVDLVQGRLVATTQGRGAWHMPLPKVVCTAVTQVKVRCASTGKISVKVSSTLVEGSVLTFTNDGGREREVIVAADGSGKAKWKNQTGAHEICLVECGDCQSATCP